MKARLVPAAVAAVLLGLVPAIAPAGAAPSHVVPGPRPPAVSDTPVKTGLNGPSAFTFAPNGAIWYLQRGTGQVHLLLPGSGADHRVLTVHGVNGSGERGALGIALHPNWPTTKQLFIYVTRRGGGHLRNQVVRFTNTGGKWHGPRVLVSTPASSNPYHNGGRILFGPDNKLYVMIGEGHNPVNAQDRTGNLRGKILRLDTDGSAAAGNPIGRIWSYGHRNSFGFTFDPTTGRLWETENGPECTDEINLIVRGGNFGWGIRENCSLPMPGGTNNSGPTPRHRPKMYFAGTIGITGDAFCDHCGLGAALDGALIFGDVNAGVIRAADLNASRTGLLNLRTLTTAPSGVHSMEVAPDGRIYFSTQDGIYRLT